MQHKHINDLGALGLAGRLKRLSDALAQDTASVYKAIDPGFEARWFSVFVFLYRNGPTSITALAKGLGVSHPGINKIANELIAAKLVAPYRDRGDKRKRVLALTSLGRERYSALESSWAILDRAVQTVLDETGGDLLHQLDELEHCLSTTGVAERFMSLSRQDPDKR